MSKRNNDQSPQRSNSTLRVRWVELELNGADTTIEEALRTVERIRKPVIEAPQAMKRIPSPTEGEKAPVQGTLFDGDSDDDAVDDSAVLDATSEQNQNGDERGNGNRKKRGEGDPKDRNAGIKLVGDIDFMPPDEKPLKELFVEKQPSSDMDQILVICHFFENVLQIPQYGPGHVLTALKHVGKPIPKDLKQTIRNMKEKKVWLKFTDIENIRIATEGGNRVDHKLGKADGKNGD